MKEIWKPVEGYEGLYEVSNTGKVKSLKRTVKSYNDLDRTFNEKILTLHSSKITERHPKPKGCKPVRGINKKTGTVVEYQSIEEAARELKGNSDAIRACLKGRSASSCGFHWEYIV